ncbi:hypothetical protein G4B88_003134 [Cannabis sativa]|uniref:Uncharacterized protein n=1 Tax=Cannabis sativa TaxID=3483 RepID=A0A7J6F6U3_CANSA|nr:hypothetical protein G4B88_003134 [Cannabis sativa]
MCLSLVPPLTTRRLPSQRLDPALPKLFRFTPTFPTSPTVAEQFSGLPVPSSGLCSSCSIQTE